MTVNQIDFVNEWQKLLHWQSKKLIYGLGITINEKTEDLPIYFKSFDHGVAHTIYGITTLEMYQWISRFCNKVLVLGYKKKGRGRQITPKHQFDISKLYKLFDIVSFDNLAIEQTGIQRSISQKTWDLKYMGDEGSFSFFIDSVESKFYKNSLETIGFDIQNRTITEMFNEISNS